MVIKFTIFHLKLVFSNNTTLEILDAERKKTDAINDYNLGFRRNWEAIFGREKYGWFFPIPNAKMTSDGIIWMKKENLIKGPLITNVDDN